jgi:hypothetical protein
MTRQITRPLLNDRHSEQRTLVRRALLGLDYWLYGRAFLLPFCDYLKILLHESESIIITLWDQGDTTGPVFSTHRHVETKFSKQFAVLVPHSERFVACYSLTKTRADAAINAHQSLRQLFEHEDFVQKNEGEVFGESLKAAASRVLPRSATHARHWERPSGETVAKQAELVIQYQDIFRNVNAVLERSPHFPFKGETKSPQALNLFPFVFVAKCPGDVAITQAVHQPLSVLSDAQCEYLNRDPARGRNRDESVSQHFQSLFGPGSETAFRAETVALAKPLEPVAASSAKHWPALKALASQHRIYVPIHIEGSPWIVLTRFFRDSEPSYWYDVFHFYHDVIPRISTMLRTESKSAYLGLIERFFSDEITNPDLVSFVGRFNKRSNSLLDSFPFARVYLTDTPSPSGGDVLSLPDGKQVTIKREANPHFEPQVAYDPLDGQSVREACERALRRAARARESFRFEMDHQAHTIFNELPTNQIEAALACSSSELAGAARSFVEDAKRKTIILETSLSIPFADRDLKHLRNATSVLQLLNWLKVHAFSGKRVPVLTLPTADQDIQFRDRSQQANAFTLLWNLWSNAAKTYPGHRSDRYWIGAESENGLLLISFRNAGEMPPQYIPYLLREGVPWPGPRDRKGLIIVKSKLKALGWQLRLVAVEAGLTAITLATNLADQSNTFPPERNEP